MKALKAGAAALFIVAFFALGWAYSLPAHWSVSRSVDMQAAPEVIYPYVADFPNGWLQWSVLDKEDPAISYSYSGSRYGLGAERSWASKKMGDGRQRITEADPKKGIRFELSMPGHRMEIMGRIAFESLSQATRVTWTEEAELGSSPLRRVMGHLWEQGMGPSFEASLAKLKALSELRVQALERQKRGDY